MVAPKTFLALLFVGMPLFPSAFALAHTPPLFPVGFWGPVVSCGYEGGPPCEDICDLVHTAQHLIYIALTILVFIIAPVAVIAGGIFIMISSGDEGRLKKGKQIVTSAVIGLAIGLGAFLIINTVLWALGGLGKSDSISWPNIQCSVAPYVPPVMPTGGGVEFGGATTTATLPPPGTLSHTDAYTRLTDAAISVKYGGAECAPGQTTGCLSLHGIPSAMVTQLIQMKDACACTINITAGTESGHREHGPGKPVVDISYGTAGLNTYIFGQIETNDPVPNRFAYLGKDGISYRYEDDPPHWHLRLP